MTAQVTDEFGFNQAYSLVCCAHFLGWDIVAVAKASFQNKHARRHWAANEPPLKFRETRWTAHNRQSTKISAFRLELMQ
jgi:hypothetical protein